MLVVQCDPINRSSLNTVVVMVLTSNTHRANVRNNVLLPAEDTGLPKASVAVATQLFTIDRAFLDTRVGQLAPKLMAQVDAGLRCVLDLP